MYKYFDKETKKTIEIPEERWGWAILYQPEPGAIAQAKRLTEERNEILKKERNRRLNDANKIGLLKEKRTDIHNWYNKETARPVKPFMNELHQFMPNGEFHRVGEIEQDKIYLASLVNMRDRFKRIDIPWKKGMRLIHKYTNTKPAGETEFKRSYCFGYKYEGREHLFYILPDDRIIMTPDQEVDLTEMGI